jgi:hypothetical protein
VQEILNATILLILVIIYPTIFIHDVVRRGPTFRAGLCFGVTHLILIPLASCALTGSLEVDQEFRTTTLVPDLFWSRDAAAINIMMLPLVTMLFAFPFIGSKNSSTTTIGEGEWKWWLSLYVVVAIFSFIAAGLTAPDAHWYRTREAFSREQGLAAVLILYVQAALQFLAVGSLFHGVLRNKISYKSAAFAIIVLAIVDLYTTGNRIWLVFMLACIVAVIIYRRKYFVMFAVAILLVPFGYLMTIFKWIRAYMHISPDRSLAGILESLQEGYEFAQQRLRLEGFGVKDFIYGVTEAIDVNVYHASVVTFGDHRALLWGETLMKVFVSWIPRSIWADKPDGITVVAAEVFAPNVRELSLVTTLFGEFYINFGLLFLVAVPVAVVVVGKIVDVGVRGVPFSNFLVFVFGVAIIRFPLSDLILNLAIAVLLYLGGRHFVRILRSGEREVLVPGRRRVNEPVGNPVAAASSAASARKRMAE